jgi:hypothetical protein
MAGPTRFSSITYDNFSAGEVGLKGLDKAPPGSFHAKNMMMYSNGFIGPRPGLKNFTPTSMPVGKLRALVETPTPDREGMFIIGNTAYYYSFRDFTIAPVALTGDVLSAGTGPLHPRLDTTTFLVAVPDAPGGVWRLNQVAGTMSQLSGAPAGVDLTIYDAQLIVVKSADLPRLLGSAPSEDGVIYDFTDGMFQDVGDNWGIGSIVVQNNYLTIIKRNSIHVLSGVFGTDNMVIRDVNHAVATNVAWHVALDNDDRVWYLPLFRENPATFSGATVTQLGQFNGLSPREGEDGVLPVKRGIAAFEGELNNSSIIAVQGGDEHVGILRHNDVVTFHQFEVPVSGMLATLNDHVVLTDGGTDSTPANIYACKFEYDRPAFTSDGNGSPGDGSNTPLDAFIELPSYFTPDGRLIRVRSVSVDIIKYNTGVATNHLTATVTTLNRTNGADDVASSPSNWTEVSSVATTDGVHDRIVFSKLLVMGQGFRIKLSNIAGIAIKSVHVEFEEQPGLPRSESNA